MAGSRNDLHHLSLFNQNIDRVAFLSYFLGGVVPFAGLVWIVQEYVLDQLPEGTWRVGAIGAVAGLACLSLGAFLALRRATRSTLARMDAHTRRLETLLDLAKTLSEARFAEDVHRTAASCAAELTGARTGVVLAPELGKDDPEPQLVASAGEESIEVYRASRSRLHEIVAPVIAQGVPALWDDESDAADAASPGAVAAVPLAGCSNLSPAALVVTAQAGERFDSSHLRLLSTVGGLAAVTRAHADLRDSQRNFFVHVTEILMAALDSHMHEQAGHPRRVAHLAIVMGRELDFDEHRLERLHFASLLHDVGMLKIDTRRQQTSAVWQRHSQIGHRMLSRIRLWADLAPFVLHHHEWWNGEGYPDGLEGDDIPLESRVIGMAEAFDSMTSRSSYRAALSWDEALGQVEQGAGTQFDPDIARLLLRLVRDGQIDGPTRV
jgi:HD-GYP domain-containing protein (c-di-GMP phosphodiesterase class II)